MTVRFLLDTDTLIAIIRGRHPKSRDWFDRIQSEAFALSAISYGELYYGAVKSQNPVRMLKNLQTLSNILPILPVDQKVASIFGTVRLHLETQGKMIGLHDLWIAAHALSLGAIVITNNEREFSRVPKLKIDNWLR